ncbi:MAG TPA: KpsF/GutQ family sugar-phosphate isomerase [bacterium]|nr:KpsF/GutQ family sugar-phosphate isomerase [bacterium]
MTIDKAKRVLTIEAQAIAGLVDRVNEDFTRAVEIILAGSGKVIVLGIGKSGLIGRKIAATLASTGTPAFFVHPAEGVHGDVGMIDKNDVVIMISYSGDTEELVKLVPALKRLGVPIIGLFGNTASALAKAADVVIDVSVPEEACPLKLAPTASTTAALAMGDALAIALLERRGFTEDDFAKLHPAGALGKKLLTRVSDLMHQGPALPRVGPGASLKDVIYEMSSKMLGHTAVVEGEKLLGVISDGDLRRAMEKSPDIMDKKAADLMTVNPRWIAQDELAASALLKMESRSITALLVCDGPDGQHLVGIVHLHDLLKAGVV